MLQLKPTSIKANSFHRAVTSLQSSMKETTSSELQGSFHLVVHDSTSTSSCEDSSRTDVFNVSSKSPLSLLWPNSIKESILWDYQTNHQTAKLTKESRVFFMQC